MSLLRKSGHDRHASARTESSTLPTSAFVLRLVVGVSLIGLLVVAMAALALRQSHRQYQEGAALATQNLAQVLANDIAGAVKADEIALLTVIDEYRRQKAAGGVDVGALNAHIERVRTRLPEIDALRIADAGGKVVFGSDVDPAAHINIADRPHFVHLRDHPGAALTVSKAQVSRVNHKWVVALARRMDRADGTFDGIAFAAVALDSLARKIAALDVGTHGAIALRDADLNLIVHHPSVPNVAPGGRVVSAELAQAVRAQPVAGVYVAGAATDDAQRTSAYRRIADYPLYVVVGLSTADYLAEWRKQAKATALLAGFCLLVTVLAARLLYLAWRHQRAATAFSETLVDSLPGVFYRLDDRQRLVTWNRTIEFVLGADGLRAAQQSMLNVIHADDREPFGAALRKAFELGHAEVEARLTIADGAFRHFHFVGVPLKIDGRSYLLGTGVDVTPHQEVAQALREKTEALLHSNADLEQFAYSVSHDMRQPLRMVTGHLQLLQKALKTRLDDDDRENLAFALDGAKRMDAMIVALLDYSRIGRLTEKKTWQESRDAVEEALRFLAPAIADSQAAITVGGVWPPIFASRDEMTRLFQNLLGNAIKYHEAGQVPRVTVESSTIADRWRISVRDQGIGIDPQQRERLFQFFARLQPRTRFDGTGMGLALCRRIVEHHDGRIWVESAGEGQGSTFVFELPLPAAAA
ncbi:MAG: PAS domain S-box protein [Rhodocyclales bacterium]|nr:PAS domain S-box protein [Rhodocyclales bacterium]